MPLQGNIFDYFFVFWAGVLVSFTPCVYPLLPITAGIIGGLNTRGTRGAGFLLSLVYVSGISVTYCALAGVAAIQGKAFGLLQNNPWVLMAVACVYFLFGLVLLDVVPFPVFGSGLQSKIRPRGMGTLFLFGMTSGFVVGPCTAPILGGLLLYVASRQNILHAVSLLFIFSYGVGASLILAGTFSGFVTRLPRSGVWLVRVKQFCALVIFFAAGILAWRAAALF